MSKRRTDLLPALGFLAPNFLGFLLFVAFPLIFSFAMAFTNWDLSLHNRFRPDEPLKWMWLRNFADLLEHPYFWRYFGNTLFMMLAIPVSIAGSLLLAVLLTRRLRSNSPRMRSGLAIGSIASFLVIGLWLMASGYGLVALVLCLLAGAIIALGFTAGTIVYRTLFYFPSFTSGVAIYLLWKQMYNPRLGPVNIILQPLLERLESIVTATAPWLWHTAGYALWCLALVGVLWFGVSTIRKWSERDFDFGTALMRFASLIVGALILYGLGLVLLRLPAMASSPEGLTAPNWLTNVHWAKPAIMIMGLWASVGSNNMLLYIAGITNIPQELYEAADIDGASRWQRFWHVTWPQLAPTTFFIIVMSVVGGLQGGFEQARTMTQGGPFGATTTLSYFIYIEGFETGRLGFASAVAWAMFAMIFVLTMFNYKFGSRYVND